MKTLRVAICLMLVVGVLAMSLSVFADNEPVANEYTIQEVNMAYYVWLVLNSFGIEISATDSLGYVDSVQDEIINLVLEYLDALPSSYSISTWIAPWQASMDYWGNYRFNSTMLEDIEDFARWLRQKFGLADNGHILVDAIYSVGGYTLYRFGTMYSAGWTAGVSDPIYNPELVGIETDVTSGTAPSGYVIIGTTNNNIVQYEVMVISSSSFDISYQQRTLDLSGSYATRGMGSTSSSNPNNKGYYTSRFLAFSGNQQAQVNAGRPANSFLPNGDHFIGNANEVSAFILNAEVQEVGDIQIVTSTILLPTSNPDYTAGDSVTIIDGHPNYSVIDWDGSVTVNNLPAIITQRNIPDIGNDEQNPGFAVPWQAINGLIQYVAVPAGAIISLVNEAPVEGVIMLYALLGGIIIFGMIRIMREH